MDSSMQGHERQATVQGDRTGQASDDAAARPYAPSRADRHKLLVMRLPGPNWSCYPGLALALIMHMLSWPSDAALGF